MFQRHEHGYARMARWVGAGASLSACIGVTTPAWTEAIDIVLMSGQSNMVGYAAAGATYPGASPADADVRYYYDVTEVGGSFADDSGGTLTTLGPWLNNGNNTLRFGMEMSLGRSLDAALDNKVALIKSATGGAYIARWQPGQVDYNRFVAAITDGIGELQSAGHTVRVLGMVWLQGESDMTTNARANAYATNLNTFISTLRSDLNADLPGLGLDDLNVFLVQPSNWLNGANPNNYTATNINKVFTAQENFASSDPHAWSISTSDFTNYSDNIHFRGIDQITLGERVAESILTTIPEPGSATLMLIGLTAMLRRRRA